VSGGRDFDYFEQGTGMFALLKMSRTQIETVRRAHGIYIVEDGRINVAGLPAERATAFVKAVLDVMTRCR
jgi:aspartate/tyrosine/aromatic aminotransferase